MNNTLRLDRIAVDTARYQLRTKPYSAKTVDAIFAKGIDLAKFDAIPVVTDGKGAGIVGGDGHSRLEAIRRRGRLRP